MSKNINFILEIVALFGCIIIVLFRGVKIDLINAILILGAIFSIFQIGKSIKTKNK